MLNTIISAVFKNMFARFLAEAAMAVFRRIAWQEVIERLLMRVIKKSLRKLAKITVNDVDDQLVEDIIASLEKRNLPKVEG